MAHVGDVHDPLDVVAHIAQVLLQHVLHDIGLRRLPIWAKWYTVGPQVYILTMSGWLGNEFLFLVGGRIVQQHLLLSFLFGSSCAAGPQVRPGAGGMGKGRNTKNASRAHPGARGVVSTRFHSCFSLMPASQPDGPLSAATPGAITPRAPGCTSQPPPQTRLQPVTGPLLASAGCYSFRSSRSWNIPVYYQPFLPVSRAVFSSIFPSFFRFCLCQPTVDKIPLPVACQPGELPV